MEVRKIYKFNGNILKKIRKENNLNVNDMVFYFHDQGHSIYPKTYYRWEDEKCKGNPNSESLMVLKGFLEKVDPTKKIDDLFEIIKKESSVS
tara:strand:- start:2515 stop:2790 length:276 start_codon:yes stop_codon:yes gene_type:complete